MTRKSYYKKVAHDRRRDRKGAQPRKFFDKSGGVTCKSCFDLQGKLDEVRQENVRLKAALKHTQKTTRKDVLNAHTPSSKIPFKKNSDQEQAGKKGGARPGHVGHGRKAADVDSADRVVDLAKPSQCSECQCGLNHRDIRSRTILEAMPVKAERVLYRYTRGVCPKCFKVYAAKPNALPKAFYGNRLISQAATMHFFHGITIGKVLSILGPQVTEGGLIDAFHRLGRLCAKAMPGLIDDYRKSEVKHADETGWRTDGSSGYAWIFSTPSTTVFDFADSRSAKVARRVLGEENLPGVLVVDRYGGYNQMPCKLQYCYAHLLREVEKLEDEFSDTQEVTAFVAELATALAEAMKLRALPITDEEYYRRAKQIQARIEAVVSLPAKHLGVRRIQEIFLEKKHRLYHWAKSRNVPPDNNRAERELRPTVIARKVSFGSQSDAGAKTRSQIMSVLFTAKKRFKDKPPEDWLKSMLDQIVQNPSADVYAALNPSTPSN